MNTNIKGDYQICISVPANLLVHEGHENLRDVFGTQ